MGFQLEHAEDVPEVRFHSQQEDPHSAGFTDGNLFHRLHLSCEGKVGFNTLQVSHPDDLHWFPERDSGCACCLGNDPVRLRVLSQEA